MFTIQTATVAKPTLVGQVKKTRTSYGVIYQGRQVGPTFYAEQDAKQLVAELEIAHERGEYFFGAVMESLDA